MTGRLGKTNNWQAEIIGQQALTEREDLFGPIPAKIVKYYPDRGTVDVQPLGKKRANGQALDYPMLLDVPVKTIRTGRSALTFPIPDGTRGMLSPMMRSNENYDDKDDGEPSDSRSFHLSDMQFSLEGGDSLTNPLPNVDADNTHLRFDPEGKYGIRGSEDGKIKIEGNQGNIYALLAQVVRLLSTDQLLIKYGSSAGSGHELQHRAAYDEIAGKLEAMALE